jgi:7-carboxy-7-deazaguanine synthase
MNPKETKLFVSEIFLSLQGEGARAGSANVFIRLQGCKTKDACFASGVRCDTEFESGREMTVEEIDYWMFDNAMKASSIIWTGGEPAQQLTKEIVAYFKEKEFFQAIETSGLFAVPENIDWISLSPKVAEHVIKKNFTKVDELRYVRHAGQSIPQPSIEADHYFVSPHSDGFSINSQNLKHCIELVKQYPKWKLSLQMHKIWAVL